MEVMGLMLGEFVDDYTVRVIDVFAMPQSGTVSKNPTLETGLFYPTVNWGLAFQGSQNHHLYASAFAQAIDFSHNDV